MTVFRRPRRTVVAALVVAGVFLSGFALLERMQVQSAPPPGTAVLVATRDLALNETITRATVRVWVAPAGAPLGVGPALALDLPRVLGRRVLAPILAGEPLARARLAGLEGSAAVAGSSLPSGYARYTVPVGPLAEPLPNLAVGDVVEVLAALPRDPASPAITATVQPIDLHALVAYVQDQPTALTLVVPRHELATLAWLRGQGAAFSFGLVAPADRGGNLYGVDTREFKRRYHVAAQ